MNCGGNNSNDNSNNSNNNKPSEHMVINVVLKMMEFYDQSPILNEAKYIMLHNASLAPMPNWAYQTIGGYYSKKNLDKILRDHTKQPIADQGEHTIRESFDGLFRFLSKIAYLVKTGYYGKNELEYYKNILVEIKNNAACLGFIKQYRHDMVIWLIGAFELMDNNNKEDGLDKESLWSV